MIMAKQSFKGVTAELNRILGDVSKVSNEALNKASELVVNRLVAKTPVDTGLTRDSWENIIKYKNVKYIYNVASTKSGIPRLNLIEFSSKGKSFAINTFRECFDEIEQIILVELNKID